MQVNGIQQRKRIPFLDRCAFLDAQFGNASASLESQRRLIRRNKRSHYLDGRRYDCRRLCHWRLIRRSCNGWQGLICRGSTGGQRLAADCQEHDAQRDANQRCKQPGFAIEHIHLRNFLSGLTILFPMSASIYRDWLPIVA